MLRRSAVAHQLEEEAALCRPFLALGGLERVGLELLLVLLPQGFGLLVGDGGVAGELFFPARKRSKTKKAKPWRTEMACEAGRG